ncbi:MAG TPA: hypothetical protein DDW31_07170 [candidate division Zixibacteria bacterium]|jgi:hypothetical protein|nr:hypothetical protein [candidate division Zixibacteria bacterium]
MMKKGPMGRPRGSDPRALFIGLSIISLLLLSTAVAVLLWLVQPRLFLLGNWAAGAAFGLAFLFMLVVGGGLTLIVISALAEVDLLFPHGRKQVTVRVLYPINLFLGYLLGIGRERIGESFVAVNNALVRAAKGRLRPGPVMLLLPHCLQQSDCRHKVTADVANCIGCGRCPLAELSRISRENAVTMVVATGGTLARRLIGEVRPAAILAVACERDLVSGIQDAYPIPVYGVLNQRPHGPCRDTTVDFGLLRQGLSVLLPAVRNGGPCQAGTERESG